MSSSVNVRQYYRLGLGWCYVMHYSTYRVVALRVKLIPVNDDLSRGFGGLYFPFSYYINHGFRLLSLLIFATIHFR